jgi:hypothetical protein
MKKIFEFFRILLTFRSTYFKGRNMLKSLYVSMNMVLGKLDDVPSLYQEGKLKTAEDIMDYLNIDDVKREIKYIQKEAGTLDDIKNDLNDLYSKGTINKIVKK